MRILTTRPVTLANRRCMSLGDSLQHEQPHVGCKGQYGWVAPTHMYFCFQLTGAALTYSKGFIDHLLHCSSNFRMHFHMEQNAACAAELCRDTTPSRGWVSEPGRSHVVRGLSPDTVTQGHCTGRQAEGSHGHVTAAGYSELQRARPSWHHRGTVQWPGTTHNVLSVSTHPRPCGS